VTVFRQPVYKQNYITVYQAAEQKYTDVSQTPGF